MKDHEDWNTVFLSRHTRQPVTLRVSVDHYGAVVLDPGRACPARELTADEARVLAGALYRAANQLDGRP
jgi:hypothetical protein